MQQAFTLIEVMIVIAIMTIIAAIAIPAFQDYLIRARVVNGLTLAGAAKYAVAASVMENNSLPANQAQTGFQSPAANDYVNSITIADDGSAEIIISYTQRAGNGTVILKPILQANQEITWNCTGGTLLNQYRPANCR